MRILPARVRPPAPDTPRRSATASRSGGGDRQGVAFARAGAVFFANTVLLDRRPRQQSVRLGTSWNPEVNGNFGSSSRRPTAIVGVDRAGRLHHGARCRLTPAAGAAKSRLSSITGVGIVKPRFSSANSGLFFPRRRFFFEAGEKTGASLAKGLTVLLAPCRHAQAIGTVERNHRARSHVTQRRCEDRESL